MIKTKSSLKQYTRLRWFLVWDGSVCMDLAAKGWISPPHPPHPSCPVPCLSFPTCQMGGDDADLPLDAL